MKRYLVPLFLLVSFFATFGFTTAQTYYYDGGSISVNDLRRARTYKKGSFMLQGSRHRGIIWIPKYNARGNRYLELMLEHFLQGTEIKDYSPIQIGAIVGGSHGTASVMALLMDLEAREMLGIDKKQGESINELFVDFRKLISERMAGFQKNNPRATKVELIMARTAEIERQSLILRSRLETILTPDQIRRSREIVFQLYGGFDTAVVDLDLLSFFELSREQREKLELVAEDANDKRSRIFAARNNASWNAADYQAFDQSMADLVVTISRKIRGVMTQEQLDRGIELMKNADEVKEKLGFTQE